MNLHKKDYFSVFTAVRYLRLPPLLTSLGREQLRHEGKVAIGIAAASMIQRARS